jgi:hypothetical protein
VTDLDFCEGGMRVHVRRSKTDQEGAGDTIAIVAGSIACRDHAATGRNGNATSPTNPIAAISNAVATGR